MTQAAPAFRLDGTRILVTGASLGIGRATALAAAASGATVVLAARGRTGLRGGRGRDRGRSAARPRCCPSTRPIRRRSARAVAAAGVLDGLVNNAGSVTREPFLEASEAEMDRVLALNVKGAALVAQAVARGMVAAGRRGSIVNMASIAGLVGARNRSLYAATKHAVMGLTRAMALELGPKGIRVNAVCPGLVNTPLAADLMADEKFVAATRARIPLGRIMEPEDIAGPRRVPPVGGIVRHHRHRAAGRWRRDGGVGPMPVTVRLCGAARTVTGLSLLFETGKARFLVDCGMFQGPKTLKALNWEAFPYAPRDIDAVLLTHAHIDHSGLLPKLVKQGFRGTIHASAPTVDLCAVMLPDSGHVQEMEVEHLNRRNRRRGREPVEPIYTAADATDAIRAFRPVPMDRWLSFDALPGVRARWWNAGHMLGSASIELEFNDEEAAPLRVLVSGRPRAGLHGVPSRPRRTAGARPRLHRIHLWRRGQALRGPGRAARTPRRAGDRSRASRWRNADPRLRRGTNAGDLLGPGDADAVRAHPAGADLRGQPARDPRHRGVPRTCRDPGGWAGGEARAALTAAQLHRDRGGVAPHRLGRGLPHHHRRVGHVRCRAHPPPPQALAVVAGGDGAADRLPGGRHARAAAAGRPAGDPHPGRHDPRRGLDPPDPRLFRPCRCGWNSAPG